LQYLKDQIGTCTMYIYIAVFEGTVSRDSCFFFYSNNAFGL
jgi:hypothetical protein